MPTLKTINDLTATAIDDNTSLELQPAAAAGTSKATVATLFGGTGNRALITRIPGEGANVIPVIGSGVVLDANTPQPTAAQAAMPFVFQATFTGTRAQLVALIVSNPGSLTDDSARFSAYLVQAIRLGWPVAYSGCVYINTPIDITVDGRKVELQAMGDGWIVGGPSLNAPVIKIANSSTYGGTAARSVPIIARGFQFDVSKAPYGVLNSVNCFNFSGFRSTMVDGCYFYHGTDFRSGNAGGDASLFTTSNYVKFTNNIAQGAPDLPVYASGSSTGTVDNISLFTSGNVFIKCANGIAVKRNYRYLKSVGDHFDGCFNGISALPANGTGDAQLCGSRVVVVGPTFRNMGSSCIDPRSSNNWNVIGAVVGGTVGYDLDGLAIADAAVIRIAGTTNSSFDAVIEVEGSTDATHSAVRIGQHTNTVNGVTSQSSGNRVRVTAKGIYNGLLENTGSTNNTIELNIVGVTNPYTMQSNNGSRVTLNNNGVRTVITGNRDTTPGSWPFSQIFTVSTTLNLSTMDRVVRFETAAGNLNAIMPAGAVNGDTVRVQKTAASGAGNVLVRDPTNTSTIFTISTAGQIKEFSFDGTNWLPVG